MKDLVADEGLEPHLRLNCELIDAVWDQACGKWIVTTSGGRFEGRVLLLGMGHLSDEAYPAIPGIETFTGEKFHSARWPRGTSLKGKRVGVVGSGASAIQVVPEVVKEAASVVVFQRSAPYITPRPDRAFTEAEKRLYRRDPEAMRELRDNVFWFLETGFASRRGIRRFTDENKAVALAHLAAQVADKDLRAKLTPDYEIGCKRVLLSNDYYPALTQDHVTLEASALERIDRGKAIARSGNAYDFDVLIFCTGFEAARPPFAGLVRGAQGQSLEQQWATGMEAFASTAVSGFPNLFMLNGPNTSLGHNSIVYIIETQIEYILQAMDWMDANAVHAIEPEAVAQAEYVDGLQDRAVGSVWVSQGCKSWYLDPASRKLTLIWPDFAHAFRQRNGAFSPEGYSARGAALQSA